MFLGFSKKSHLKRLCFGPLLLHARKVPVTNACREPSHEALRRGHIDLFSGPMIWLQFIRRLGSPDSNAPPSNRLLNRDRANLPWLTYLSQSSDPVSAMRLIQFLSAFSAPCLALCICADLLAADFIVTSDSDAGPGSLRAAIDQANSTAEEDTIRFADGLGEIVLTSGQIDITAPLIIEGPESRQLIRSAGSRIFRALSFPGTLSLRSVELLEGFAAGGNTDDCSDSSGHGGAICSESHLAIEDSVFSMNSSERGGGAVFVKTAELQISGSLFLGNQTLLNEAEGGAILQYNRFDARFNTKIESSTFAENRTSGEDSPGGAVFLLEADASITNSSFDGNQASFESRGGALGMNDTDLLIQNVTASNNSAYWCGGAFFLEYAGPSGIVSIHDSTLVGNSVLFSVGGAICASRNNNLNHLLEVVNTTIQQNSALLYGSAIFTNNWLNVHIMNSTIVGNELTGSHPSASAVYVDSWNPFFPRRGDFVVASSIIANNEPSIPDVFDRSFGANEFDRYFSNNIFGNLGDLEPGANAIMTTDPRLSSLANNGCATPAGFPAMAECVQTAMPLPDSPAILNGLNPLELDYDQRGQGYLRSYFGETTIGAVSPVSGAPISGPFPVNVLEDRKWLLFLVLAMLMMARRASASHPVS